MTISDIVIPKGTNCEYGFGQYGLGVYFYDVLGKVLLFIQEKDQ